MAQEASNTSYNVLFFYNYNDLETGKEYALILYPPLVPEYMIWNHITDSNYCQGWENY